MAIQSAEPIICIAHAHKSAYSETFIHAHINRLPARVKVLYGGMFPRRQEDDRSIVSLPWFLVYSAALFSSKVWGRPAAETQDALTGFIQARALGRFLKENRVEVMLAEYGQIGVSVMDACQRAGIPLVVHFHGADAYLRADLEKYGASYRRMFQVAAAVIAVSRDMEKQLLSLGAPRDRLHYNPYGVDGSLFVPTDPGANPPVFVATGRFVDKKAPHLTLLAFKQVVEACPESRLVMLGDGTLQEACQQLTRALGISGQVAFLGACSHTEVAARMGLARAFVQHSVTTDSGDCEGTPVSVIEAGAAGLPVVSTRHAGIKEAVIHGETGFLVEEGDIDGMARHMIALAQDGKLASALGRQAAAHIAAHFSMEKSISRLWEIMSHVMRPR